MTEAALPDRIGAEVPVGARVLIVSQLHLPATPTPASSSAATELTRAIDGWTGPGLVIFNGGGLELLAGGSADPRPALAAHPALVACVRQFARRPDRRVIYLPGTHDSRAAWDPGTAAALTEQLGAELALTAELHVETGTGTRLVRVEPGHRLDPLASFADPRNPADTPLGQHLLCDVLPALHPAGGGAAGDRGWLAGLESLDDPAAFPRFLASRLVYRRLGRHAWWLLVPLLVAAALRLPLAVARRAHHQVAPAWHPLLYLGVVTVVDLILVGLVAGIAIRRTWTALAGVALSRAGDREDLNQPARALARDLITAGGAGLVTGHTRHPELAQLGPGFYANTGCACEVVAETPSRLDRVGMPSLFLAHRQIAWVELEAGSELHVRLLYGQRNLPGATILERLLSRPQTGTTGAGIDSHPGVVASFPRGQAWPPPVDVTPRLRRIRRWASVLVALAGLLSLVSAFVQPAERRLRVVLHLLPLAVPQAADALVALASVGLLLLARGVRRGQHHAWLICEGLLVGSVVLHLVKGVDIEEAVIAAAVAAYLFVNRDAFRAGVDVPSAELGVRTLVWGTATAVAAGTIGIEFGTMLSRSSRHRRMPLPRAFLAASERLIGVTRVALPERLDDFVAPAMLTVAVGLSVAAAWLMFRPVVARRAHPAAGGPQDDGLNRARDIVRRHGAGTLDYFAVRSDKQFYFWGDSVVAYGVYGGVCLVSPDPIGPAAEREETWKAFRRFADEQGWTVSVLGAGEGWLPTYRASGMHDLYLGDEGVIDCRRFTLDGGRYKGLRQAVNRVAKRGYTTTFHDPSRLDPGLREQLATVMTKSRRGDVERGFSMTLGRAFDPEDHDLLLAVVHSPDGDAVAFCQYVPAAGIDGYSLDLMRRDNGDHPNGLMDFAIVETIRHLRAEGRQGLGLNFATMRAVLAGEAGEGLSQRVQAWLLHRMSGTMQIESLWKFNAKYDPDWQPRYALYDSPEQALPTAVAVARAESFWELPVIGRFLVPDDKSPVREPAVGEPSPEGGGAAPAPVDPAGVGAHAWRGPDQPGL